MIIGLIGFKQVGKSTAAKHLEEKHVFVRHNMKDALVAEIKQNFPDLLDCISELTYGEWDIRRIDKNHQDLFQDKPPLMRALLQNYGTEVRRGDRDSYWTDQWVSVLETEKVTSGNGTVEIGRVIPKDTKVVTDDVRFKNEARVVKDNGGILIRLTRPDITTGGSHASETEQLEIEADYTIECQPGDHEHLYRELDRIVAELQKKFNHGVVE